MKYVYSRDGERFDSSEFDSTWAALEEAFHCDPEAEGFYVGIVRKRTIGFYFSESDAERLLESLVEFACDECGEVANDWLVVPTCYGKDGDARAKAQLERTEWFGSLVDDIRSALEKWAAEKGEQPNFYHVSDVKYHPRGVEVVE